MSGQAAEREQQVPTSGTSILRHGRHATYLMLKACGNEIGRMCRKLERDRNDRRGHALRGNWAMLRLGYASVSMLFSGILGHRVNNT